eukprot:TRINITY_DN37234_c0_g1_i2.p1 TRINITY_DN37234_c0_g1~~TRINITY_DN37234_c0_g1_i2.p1  ORF type:complete len:135 (+),score=49.63 TRINITY_DN37234_c0_g1_i2:160-564(+)
MCIRDSNAEYMGKSFNKKFQNGRKKPQNKDNLRKQLDKEMNNYTKDKSQILKEKLDNDMLGMTDKETKEKILQQKLDEEMLQFNQDANDQKPQVEEQKPQGNKPETNEQVAEKKETTEKKEEQNQPANRNNDDL